MNAAELTDKLGLHSLRHRNWYIQATCATSGDGLYEGLDWLANQLKNKKWEEDTKKGAELFTCTWQGILMNRPDSGIGGDFRLSFSVHGGSLLNSRFSCTSYSTTHRYAHTETHTNKCKLNVGIHSKHLRCPPLVLRCHILYVLKCCTKLCVTPLSQQWVKYDFLGVFFNC